MYPPPRAVIQQPLSFFLEGRQRLFTEYDKEYGTREPVGAAGSCFLTY
jgi:hypothetical protein